MCGKSWELRFNFCLYLYYFLYIAIFFFHIVLLKRSFPSLNHLATFVENQLALLLDINLIYTCTPHCHIHSCLYLSKKHTILITRALGFILKPGSVSSLTLCVCIFNFLTLLQLFAFPYKVSIKFDVSFRVFVDALYQVEKFHSCPRFGKNPFSKWCWILSNDFLHLLRWSYDF